MDSTLADRLRRLADEKQGELFAILRDLVAFPTVSPPARNTLEAQKYVQETLQEAGFETELWEVYPGDPNVTAVKPGVERERFHSLLLNGHIDVAEVGDESGWKRPPFQLSLEQGRAYGRGTADMKGGLAALLFAVKLLDNAGVELKGDLLFQSVIGEEAGEAGTRACVEKGCHADFAVVADTSNLAIQGQGGVITGWITIQSPVTYHDGLRARMIHAGGGIHGASAIEKMMKLIQGLQELERHWAVTKTFPGFAPGTATINPAVIEGGRHAAFVADRCALWITVHFYPNEDYETVAAEIEDHLLRIAAGDPWLRDNPPSFRWGGRSMIEDRGEIFPALLLDEQSQGMRLLKEIHSSIMGSGPQVGMSPSVNDAGWLGRAGIPTVTYGPGELKEAHSVDESVQASQLLDYAKIMACFIADFCNRPKAAAGPGEDKAQNEGKTQDGI